MLKPSNFGLLGRIEAGRQAEKHLLTFKPDFSNRGRALIGHYINFEELVERAIDGLSKVGLKIS
jgi:hypothetical protein